MRSLRKRFRKFLARAAWPARTSFTPLGMPADPILHALTLGQDISEPVAVVVSHPDDETIGMGARLRRLKHLTLIHVTNGASGPEQAKRKGFADAASYSAARFEELNRALRHLDAHPVQHHMLGFVDGQAVRSLGKLVDFLAAELRSKAVVFTHPYEGGHPDHDACAFAVQQACERLSASGAAPIRIEFSGYHAHNGRKRAGVFCPAEKTSTALVRLESDERELKAKAYGAFASQPYLRSTFRTDREAYRAAPLYDFTRPPAPQAWLYDGFGWDITGPIWLNYAREAANAI